MNQLICDLRGVAVYLDDISGIDEQEHLRNIWALLQCSQEKGQRCKLEKCCFEKSAVEYLSHTLSRRYFKWFNGGCRSQNAPTYNCCKLASFLGAVQFYSKFIHYLSTMTEPLIHHTRKGMSWTWTTEEQAKFQNLKDALCKDTVLALYELKQEIGISCDASNAGIGAMVFHRYQDGSERLIFNVSKTPKPTVHNAGTITSK